jgi:flagellar basal-body rod protein FlgG
MSRALFTAATGMQVQQQNVDNIANNLANASTVGFKRVRLEFQDILYQNIRTPGASANASTAMPVGLQIGLGARAISSERISTSSSRAAAFSRCGWRTAKSPTRAPASSTSTRRGRW